MSQPLRVPEDEIGDGENGFLLSHVVEIWKLSFEVVLLLVKELYSFTKA